MKKPYLYGIIALAIAVLVAGYFMMKEPPYDPALSVSDFVPSITNRYFALQPGAKFTYEGKTAEGLERIEVLVTDQTRVIQGVTTTVVRDTVHRDGVLIEDTWDWYAQDKDGNVWYFGEAVDNYENGKVADHEGSWEAGVDGAKPGIAMLAAPKIGDEYRQEYAKGAAEDMGTVVALDATAKTKAGTYMDCLKTRDWSRIDKKLNEYKYYCPAVGFITLEEAEGERVELVKIGN